MNEESVGYLEFEAEQEYKKSLEDAAAKARYQINDIIMFELSIAEAKRLMEHEQTVFNHMCW